MLGIFLDTETNGLNTKKHRIVEIAYKILDVETGCQQEAFESIVYQPMTIWKQSDPLSLKINGFSWDMIKKGVSEKKVAEAIKLSFKKIGIQRNQAVFICQNPSFDRAFFNQLIDADTQESLNWPYHWLDLASMFWAKHLMTQKKFPWDIGLSKNTIAESYHLEHEKTPHKAMNGVNHLISCYQAVVGFPKKLEKTLLP